jgi:hypothetical protein
VVALLHPGVVYHYGNPRALDWALTFGAWFGGCFAVSLLLLTWLWQWFKLAVFAMVLLLIAVGVGGFISDHGLASSQLPLPAFLASLGSVITAITLWRPAWCGARLGGGDLGQDSLGSALEAATTGLGLIVAAPLVAYLGREAITQAVIGGIAGMQLFRRPLRAVLANRLGR